MQFFLKHGADVHLSNNLALRWSSSNGHLSVVQCLLQHGGNVHAENDQALSNSAHRGYLDVVQLLIEHGADIKVGLDAAQTQPHVLTWLEDYQRMNDEEIVLHQVIPENTHTLQRPRF